MRTPLILSTLLTVCAFAGAATAQSASQGRTPDPASGLRYLSWPGKTAPAPAPAQAYAQAQAVQTTAAPPPTAAPIFEPVPLARIPAPAPSRPGLTPASAWLSPKPAAPAPTPVAYAPAPRPAAQPAPKPVDAPAPVVAPEPAPIADDPMAPRADAPIFRLQRPAAPPATTSAEAAAPAPAPAWSAPRYYSLHRQAGHDPDPIAMPQAVYLDALPVELAQTPQSADLAEPPAAPSLMRNADGRLMAAPQIEGDALP